MNEIPLSLLFLALLALLGLSAFFSGSETALTMLNRYRLLHRSKKGHPGAKRARALLQHQERFIGFILLGNTFANILAASLATIIALRLAGERGIAIGAGILTLAILILAEVAPKTLATLHPDRLAYPAARIILPLARLCYPLVRIVNTLAMLLLRLLGCKPGTQTPAALNKDELRALVAETGTLDSDRYHNMMLSVLDLESATVEDIMLPRNEIVGIDLDTPLEEVITQITQSRHTRLPVYRKSIDKVIGLLHLRKALIQMMHKDFTKEALTKCLDRIYYVPAHMPLHKLLRNFKHENSRLGLVVDEYGDVLGLVTLEDLLREIVGEFTPDPVDVAKAKDGTYLVDAGLSLRELNRITGWSLPTEGPKTLNGLIIEYLETIPAQGTGLKLGGLRLEITKMENNAIKQVRFYP